MIMLGDGSEMEGGSGGKKREWSRLVRAVMRDQKHIVSQAVNLVSLVFKSYFLCTNSGSNLMPLTP